MRENRASWADIWAELACLIAKRSPDPSSQVGAVIVTPDNVLLSTGYNGPPRGWVLSTVPWDQRPAKYSYIVHAEENAWLFALQRGVALKGCTMYVSGLVCHRCALRIAHLQLYRVVYGGGTPRVCDEEDQVLTRDILAYSEVRYDAYQRTTS